jgi:ParB family chromosome partitioning protein
MRLSTSFVAVRKITSSTSSSDFDRDRIEGLAHQIVRSEGIIRPLVLNRTSLESYEVVDGHFEYHAAVRAREIDLRRAEMIAAYIIEAENNLVSDAIIEQINILKQPVTSNTNQAEPILDKILESEIYPQSKSSYSDESIEALKLILSKLSAHDLILNSLQRALTEVVEIKEQIKLMKPLHNNSEPFIVNETSLETALEKIVEKVIVKHLDTIKSTNTTTAKPSVKSSKQPQYTQEQELAFIDGLNTYDVSQLIDKMLQSGYSDKYAKSHAMKFYNCRRIKNYESIEDIQSRKDANNKSIFSEATLTKLIKNW